MQKVAAVFGAVLAWLVAAFHGTPDGVRTATEVVALFITLDTISGVVVAAKARSLASRHLRVSLVSKLTQYTLFFGLAVGIKIIIGSWFPIQWSLGGIAMIEVVSILENIKRLDKLGGVPFGPARPAIRWMAQFFEQGIGGLEEPTDKEIEDKK